MSVGTIPDSTPQEGRREWIDVGPALAVVFYTNGEARFVHPCDRGERGRIVCAPRLQLAEGRHVVVERYPLTITPSILCPDCGTHGFVTAGRWVPVPA